MKRGNMDHKHEEDWRGNCYTCGISMLGFDTEKVTRLEVIDHTACEKCTGQGGTEDVWCPDCNGTGCKGREVVFWDKNKQVDLSLQDEGKTLKVFIHERYEDNHADTI